MEIDNISDSDRITANADVLSTVESEIGSLEQMFAALESLKTEKDRLTAAVQSLTEDEARTLQDDGSSESAVVKKLIEIRTRRDVQSARLSSTQDKIKTQKIDLANQGEAVRRAFQFVVGRFFVAREERVTAALVELFGDWIVLRDGKRLEMRHLAKQTRLMAQARNLDVKLSHPITDPAQEEFAMRHRLRAWLGELTDIVTREPQLAIRNVPADQQKPIEQSRELVTA